jgi:hypothetical protein
MSPKSGTFIGANDLPGELGIALKRMGGRLMSATSAATSLAGALTDGDGTRPVQITIQAPGDLRFHENDTSRTLAFDGKTWQTQNPKGGKDDERIEESLLAHFPDAFFLQLANGGSLRRIGSRFRTDNGKTPNYTGPYWSVYEYSPATLANVPAGKALQQSYLIALDESTWLISEVRVLVTSPGTALQVTQTKFNNWFQQAGQWYPGQIIRVENGQQVLSLTIQQGATGSQLDASSFQP